MLSIEGVSSFARTYTGLAVPTRAFVDSLVMAFSAACGANYGNGHRWLDLIKHLNALPPVVANQGTLLDATDAKNYFSTREQAIKALLATPGLSVLVILRLFWLDIQDAVAVAESLNAVIDGAQASNQTISRA